MFRFRKILQREVMKNREVVPYQMFKLLAHMCSKQVHMCERKAKNEEIQCVSRINATKEKSWKVGFVYAIEALARKN